ncbi:MAG TPA: hypothetical protein VJH68_03740 [Candidatus Nanoarchaeia archaeon]|nr:hypothetical protein [Candidatus Nanoarchaeia archaeon]
MDQKGAMELSINMLIVIILSIVILASGVTLMYKFISGAEDTKQVLDSKTSAELERLLVDQGQMVALPLSRAELNGGESHLFGLGILNIGGVGNLFKITAELSQATDESEKEIPFEDAEKQQITNTWLFYDTSELSLTENEHRKESISVTVPKDALKGEYIFNVKVWYASSAPAGGVQDSQYGNTQKFYIKVK